jgi:hypothetical protein
VDSSTIEETGQVPQAEWITFLEGVSDLNEEMICTGCGVVIQTTDPQQPGYVPERALGRQELICQRCFRIRHYNDVLEVSLEAEDYRKILDAISARSAVVVMVVDLFDLEGSWISGINRLIGFNPLHLAANKMDLFPPETNWRRMEQWLYRQACDQGIQLHGISFVSAEKDRGIQELIGQIDRLRDGKAEDVYIVGMTNVGKSTLINRLLGRLSAGEMDKPGERMKVTTSPFPGTTLDTINIPLGDGGCLIDTPGLIHPRRLTHYLLPEDLRQVVPQSRLRPKIYQLEAGQTLFFGGLARLDFLKGSRQSFVCYASNTLRIHRTKLERADALYREHLGGLLSPPAGSGIDRYPSLYRRHFHVKKGQDVAISGLGWIAVKGERAEIEVWAPKEIDVVIRESMF